MIIKVSWEPKCPKTGGYLYDVRTIKGVTGYPEQHAIMKVPWIYLLQIGGPKDLKILQTSYNNGHHIRNTPYTKYHRDLLLSRKDWLTCDPETHDGSSPPDNKTSVSGATIALPERDNIFLPTVTAQQGDLQGTEREALLSRMLRPALRVTQHSVCRCHDTKSNFIVNPRFVSAF